MQTSFKLDLSGNISPLLKKVMDNGFDPLKKYSIIEIYGKPMIKATSKSKWGVYAHRNSTGARSNINTEEYIHIYKIDASGCRYLETNFHAWADHPKTWNTDPIGTKYTMSTYMEFYRPTITDDFEFIGFSGGKDNYEKVDDVTIRMYLQW